MVRWLPGPDRGAAVSGYILEMMHVGPPVVDAHRQLLEPDLAVGEACDAVYSVDGQWYPGRVVKDRFMMAEEAAVAGLDAHTSYTIDFSGYNEQEVVHCSKVRRRLKEGDNCEAVHPHYDKAAKALQESKAKNPPKQQWGSEAKKATAAAAVAEELAEAAMARWQKAVVESVTADGYVVRFTEWSDLQLRDDAEKDEGDEKEEGSEDVDAPLTVTNFAGDARRCAHGLSAEDHYKPSARPEPIAFITGLHDGVYHSLTINAPLATSPMAVQGKSKAKGAKGPTKSVAASAKALPASCTVDRLIPGHTYAMRVRAINTAGEGPTTQPSLLRTHPAPPARPPPPRLVSATRDSIKIVMTRPYEEFGSAIDSWRVELREDTTGTINYSGSYLEYGSAALVALINTSKKTSEGFRAVYSGPLGRAGIVIGGAAGEKPSTPKGGAELGAVVAGDGKSKSKKGKKKQGSSGGQDVGGGGASASVGVCVRNELTIRGLPSGESHWVRVSAHNAAGLSAVSAAVRFSTAAAPPPPPPRPEVKLLLARVRDVDEGDDDEGQVEQLVELRWISHTRNNGSEILCYTVQKAVVPDDGGSSRKREALAWVNCDVQEQGAGTVDNAEGDGVDRLRFLYTERGAASGNSYHFRVQAANAVGAGVFSEVVKCRAGESIPGAPDPPTVVGSAQATIVKLKWDAPSETGGAPITGYALEQEGAPPRPLTGSNNMRLAKLKPATEYRFRVLAANKVGDGPWSEWMSVTTAASPASDDGGGGHGAGHGACKGKKDDAADGFNLATVTLDAPSMLECVEFYPTGLVFAWEEVEAANQLRLELATAAEALKVEAEAAAAAAEECTEGEVPTVKLKQQPQKYHVLYRLEVDDGVGGQFVCVYEGVDVGASVTNLRPSRTYRTRVRACAGLGAYSASATSSSSGKKGKSRQASKHGRTGPFSEVEFVSTLAAESRTAAKEAEQRRERIEAKKKKIEELKALIAKEDGVHDGDKWKVKSAGAKHSTKQQHTPSRSTSIAPSSTRYAMHDLALIYL
jgi:hypothetical protein